MTDERLDEIYDAEVCRSILDSELTLDQFIKDGGEPWAIYKTEVAFLGRTLEQVARSDWQMF